MNRRPFVGLAGRLSLYAALLIVLAAGGIAVRLSLHEAELAHASLRNLGLSTVQTASGLAELGLASGNPEEMQRVADTIGAFPGVVSVELFDVSGRSRVRVPHLSGSARARVLPLPRPDAPVMFEPDASATQPDVLEFVAPVRIGPRLALPGESDAETEAWPVGYVALSLGTHAVSERVRQFIRSSMTTAAVMVALGCAGMAAISWRTVRPLRRLTRAAAAVADGNLDTTVRVRSRDEVGQLSVAFNRMTARLRAMHDGLVESQQQLEARVEERTRSLQQATAEAWRLAKHDVLTGLPNRAYLAERLEASVARAGERGRQVAVLFVDLDNFKTINDSLGHPVGDRMLRAVSQRLVASAGDDGFVARLSGDEFVVVRDIGEARHAPTDLVALAARLLRLLAEPVRQPDGRELTLGASIGIALYPDDATDATGLLRAADTAMYAAKRNGRMNYQFFDAQMDAEAHERLQIESALRQAFARGEFELWYQPQFAAATGELVGAEALLRWRHPERGLMSPAAFIQIAEQNGMIRQIGAWVLQTAAHQCKAWNARAASPLRVAVNVSPHQLNRSNLVETVEAALRAADLPAHLLELELTESGIIEDPERGLALLARLRALGVRLSIDDFGTGYSSFSHLTRLPVQTVKVDRSFVQGLPGSRSDAAVAEAICAMAKRLGLRTLAEGVETPEQLAALARMGYDEVQGYLLGRPMPAAAFQAACLAVRDAGAAAGAYA